MPRQVAAQELETQLRRPGERYVCFEDPRRTIFNSHFTSGAAKVQRAFVIDHHSHAERTPDHLAGSSIAGQESWHSESLLPRQMSFVASYQNG